MLEDTVRRQGIIMLQMGWQVGMAGRSRGWHAVTGTLLISPPVLKFGGWFVTLDLGQIWDFRL